MLADMGVMVSIELITDASAAQGIACRRGVGRVRHLEVQELWLQHQVAAKHLSITKVRTDCNIADVFTKCVTSQRMAWAMRSIYLYYADGRHQLAPSADAGVTGV